MRKPLSERTYRARAVTLYRVWEEMEKNDGRGGRRIVGYALDRWTAEAHARDKGVMGFPTEVTEHEAIELSLVDDHRHLPESRQYVLLDDVWDHADLLGIAEDRP